jgi:hypothetical protein
MRGPDRAAFAALVIGLLMSFGCRQREFPIVRGSDVTPISSRQRPRQITHIYPDRTRSGEPFNRQPDGAAAIAVIGSGFAGGDRIYWNEVALDTTFGDPTLLTAIVPHALYGRPGDVVITVRTPGDSSARYPHAIFRVEAAADRP